MGNLLSLRSDKSNFNSDVFVDFESTRRAARESATDDARRLLRAMSAGRNGVARARTHAHVSHSLVSPVAPHSSFPNAA